MNNLAVKYNFIFKYVGGFVCFNFFGVLGFEFRALHLLGSHSAT
jgi:hypothetical protein